MKRMNRWLGIMISVILAAGSLQAPVFAAETGNTAVETEMEGANAENTEIAEDEESDEDFIDEDFKDENLTQQAEPADDEDQEETETSSSGETETVIDEDDQIEDIDQESSDEAPILDTDEVIEDSEDHNKTDTNIDAAEYVEETLPLEEITEEAVPEDTSTEEVYEGTEMPEDAEYWCGHYYYVFDESLTPLAAAAKCHSMGGYLATATTYNEYNQIWKMISAKSKGKAAYQLSDISKGTDGWYWDSGEELCYTNWAYFDGKDGGNGVHTLYAGRALGWSDEALDPKNCGKYNGWNGTSYIEEGTTASTHHIAIGNGTITFSRYAIWGGRTSVSTRGSMFEYNDSDAAIGFVCEWGDPITIKPEHVFLNGQTAENESPVKYTFSGDSKQPNRIEVYYEGVRLSLNQDYVTEIKGRSQVGVARVLVTGINRFEGTATEYYYVVPPIPSGLSFGGSVDRRSITFKWNKVDNAKGYRIQYSTSYSFSGDVVEKDYLETEDTQYIVNNLESGTKYYFRVAAIGDPDAYDCVSDWSYSASHTTDSSGLWMTIFSNKNNVINGGHSFLNIENLTGEDVYIGTFKLPDGDNAYIGARMVKDEENDNYIKESTSGIVINAEGVIDHTENEDDDNVYRDFSWYTVSIKKSDLETLYERMKQYGSYSLTSNNCAHFATKTWNAIVAQNYKVPETGIPGTLKSYIIDTLKGSTASELRFNNKKKSDIMVMDKNGDLMPFTLETGEYLSAINSLKVKSSEGPGVTLEWNSPRVSIGKDQYNITKVEVYATKNGKDYTTISLPADATTCTITKLDPGAKYSFKIYGVSDHKSTNMGIVTGSKTTIPCETTTLPGATSKVTCTNVASGIKVSWNTVEGATSYFVYRDNKQIFKTSALAVTDKDVKYNSGTKYVYKVVATTKNVGDSQKARTATMYRLMPVGIKSLTNPSAGKMTVTYDKASGSSGYVVRYGLKSDMSDAKVITVQGANTLSRTFGGMQKGKTYYVQVRTYKIDNGVRYYSGYCTTKKIKISK